MDFIIDAQYYPEFKIVFFRECGQKKDYKPRTVDNLNNKDKLEY